MSPLRRRRCWTGSHIPADLRNFSPEQLRQLADELRAETIDAVSVTGGHLGAALGVVELTVALHAVFDTPRDRLIWDVGHQAYPHKILTGRRDRIRTLRQGGGLSGFTRRAESEYDPFGAAHSSTSISAGLGMAVARDLKTARGEHDDRNVIAVIGDGAMSAGMAYEAMNNAGARHSRLIVMLNDNDMSIAPAGGRDERLSVAADLLAQFPRRCATSASRWPSRFPRGIERTARRAEEYARGMLTGGTLFEELGFYYVGPIDGHNLDHLLPVLRNVREAEEQGPILVHVITRRARATRRPSSRPTSTTAFPSSTSSPASRPRRRPGRRATRSVFADALIAEAERDPNIVAITAAMPSGTGLDRFAKRFPDRCFDVGIAEQHAVTFAAGLATEGMKPFCAIYSTFLQRAYDQVVHDVAIQSLPVRFAHGPRRAGGQRRRDACRQFRPRLSRLPAGHGGDGAGRRGGAGARGRHRGARSTTGRARSATRAAKVSASRCRNAASAVGARPRAACCGRAAASPSCRSAPGWRTRCARRTNWRRAGCRRRWPTRASPSRWTPR